MRATLGLLAGVLVAVGSSSANGSELSHEEKVQACLEMNGEMLKCKAEMVDEVMANLQNGPGRNLSPDQLRSIRDVAVQQIEEQGSGPIEQRRARCEYYIQMNAARSHTSHETYRKLKACLKKVGCHERAVCVVALSNEERALPRSGAN